MYCDKSFIKNDKYHAITLHSTSDDIPELERKFIDYYDKEKPKKFFNLLHIHLVYLKKN